MQNVARQQCVSVDSGNGNDASAYIPQYLLIVVLVAHAVDDFVEWRFSTNSKIFELVFQFMHPTIHTHLAHIFESEYSL